MGFMLWLKVVRTEKHPWFIAEGVRRESGEGVCLSRRNQEENLLF